MRDITVQNVANPHSRVRRDFASGAVRSVELLPLQLRSLEVAQRLLAFLHYQAFLDQHDDVRHAAARDLLTGS